METRPINSLTPYDKNPRQISDTAIQQVLESLKLHGQVKPIILSEAGHPFKQEVICCGHTTLKALQAFGADEVKVVVKAFKDEAEFLDYNVRDNKSGEFSGWDFDGLANMFDMEELQNLGFSEDDLDIFTDEPEEGNTEDDAIPDEVEAISKLGDLWILGEHRLLCGDSTSVEDVGRLMDGVKAQLLHADPPYGMGKEKDGVLNDNLHGDNLDGFQMQWWKSFRPSLDDNASAYIWGTPEDLWRLWYKGGLNDYERLTFRNEIVWNKGHGQGMESEQHRMFPTASERCLFFMLGEQGFNNNADNYWEGFEPIRLYLKNERDGMGWNNKTVADWFGFHPRMADHWFSKSQWSFPQREQYERLQSEAKGKAFKKDYDQLKQAFYETRAFFNNTHENMTDVWQFERVTGEDRHGHATPKPVKMCERAIKSSCPDDGIVVEPFLGSGSTLIACEKTKRKCYGMELDPHYVDICVKRWEEFTGNKAVKFE